MATYNYLPAVYDWPSAVKGDTFDGIALTSVTVDGANPASALAATRIHFRTAPDSTTTSLELTSADGEITIGTAATWACTVEPFTITLAVGTYYYDWEFTDVAGNVRTYLAGSWRITQNITRT